MFFFTQGLVLAHQSYDTLSLSVLSTHLKDFWDTSYPEVEIILYVIYDHSGRAIHCQFYPDFFTKISFTVSPHLASLV